MKSIASVIFAIFFVLISSEVADAKRGPIPVYEVCNKTKHDRHLATHGYSGRAHYTSKGWVVVKAGQCADVRGDTFHLKRGKRPAQLDPKRAVSGCVVADSEKFRVSAERENMPARCSKANGRMLDFYRPRPKTKRIVLR